MFLLKKVVYEIETIIFSTFLVIFWVPIRGGYHFFDIGGSIFSQFRIQKWGTPYWYSRYLEKSHFLGPPFGVPPGGCQKWSKMEKDPLVFAMTRKSTLFVHFWYPPLFRPLFDPFLDPFMGTPRGGVIFLT